jgi:hypothetical protein
LLDLLSPQRPVVDAEVVNVALQGGVAKPLGHQYRSECASAGAAQIFGTWR